MLPEKRCRAGETRAVTHRLTVTYETLPGWPGIYILWGRPTTAPLFIQPQRIAFGGFHPPYYCTRPTANGDDFVQAKTPCMGRAFLFQQKVC